MENKLDLAKIAKKRQYKIRGVFLSFESVNNYIGKVYISKGTGKDKKIFVFTTTGTLTRDFMSLPPKYRVKLYFTIKCKQYNDKWFTELVIQSYEHWAINEDKIIAEAKQLSLLNEKAYAKNIGSNDEFLNQ